MGISRYNLGIATSSTSHETFVSLPDLVMSLLILNLKTCVPLVLNLSLCSFSTQVLHIFHSQEKQATTQKLFWTPFAAIDPFSECPALGTYTGECSSGCSKSLWLPLHHTGNSTFPPSCTLPYHNLEGLAPESFVVCFLDFSWSFSFVACDASHWSNLFPHKLIMQFEVLALRSSTYFLRNSELFLQILSLICKVESKLLSYWRNISSR